MKILHLSDTHSSHVSLGDMPEADVVVHSGDFCMVGSEAEAQKSNIDRIPSDTDILITHSPAYGILDFDDNINYSDEHLLNYVIIFCSYDNLLWIHIRKP